jgi:hypothetical protein
LISVSKEGRSIEPSSDFGHTMVEDEDPEM